MRLYMIVRVHKALTASYDRAVAHLGAYNSLVGGASAAPCISRNVPAQWSEWQPLLVALAVEASSWMRDAGSRTPQRWRRPSCDQSVSLRRSRFSVYSVDTE
jgi:hypothetical protein